MGAALVHVGRWMDLTKLTGTFATMQMCLKKANLMISPCCLSVHALWPFINRLINYHKTWHKHYATQHRPEEVNKPPNVLTTVW